MSDNSNDGKAPFAELQPEAIMESYRNWATQVGEIQHALMGSAEQTRNRSLDFAMRIAQCKEPTQAMQLCTDWLNGQRDAFFDDGRRLYEMMFGLWGINLAPPRPSMERPTDGRRSATQVVRLPTAKNANSTND